MWFRAAVCLTSLSSKPHAASNYCTKLTCQELAAASEIDMASCSSFDFQDLPEVSDSPHQPGTAFKFPKRSFGKKSVTTRSFQSSWFQQWPFLHYDEGKDLAYCHICVTSYKQKKMRTSKADPAFVSNLNSLR